MASAGGGDLLDRPWRQPAASRGPANAVAVGQVGGRDVIVSAGNDRTVRVWDPATTTQTHQLDGHTGWVLAVALGQVGGRDVIVSAGADGTVRVWNGRDGVPVSAVRAQ